MLYTIINTIATIDYELCLVMYVLYVLDIEVILYEMYKREIP